MWNVNCYNHYVNKDGCSSKIKNETLMWSSNSSSEFFSKQNSKTQSITFIDQPKFNKNEDFYKANKIKR